MKLRRHWSLALLGLLLAPAIGWATYRHVRQSETWDLVYEAATAHERVGYRGTFAPKRWKNKSWSTVVEHDARSGNTRYNFGKGGFTAGAPSGRLDPAGWCLDLELVQRNYKARVRGLSRFIGRSVQIVELEPRHDGRPLVQLTLDADTRLALRVVTLSAAGKTIRTLAFRTIEIGPRAVEPGKRWGTDVSPEALSESVGFDVLTPDYLPEGFHCQKSRISTWAGTKATLYYTDGVTAFEIRQSQVQTPAAIESALRKRMGRRGAERIMKRILARRMRVLAQNDEEANGLAVRRRRHGSYLSFDLRVDRIDVHLSSRTDLDADEMLRVLRSLD